MKYDCHHGCDGQKLVASFRGERKLMTHCVVCELSQTYARQPIQGNGP